MYWRAVVCSVWLVPLAGCALFQTAAHNIENEKRVDQGDAKIVRRMRHDAEDVLRELCRRHPKRAFSLEFREGFKDGYVDYLDSGGPVRPPVAPPARFRSPKYMCPEGHVLMKDYLLAFEYGGNVGQSTGRRQFFIVPVLITDAPQPPPLNITVMPPPPPGLSDEKTSGVPVEVKPTTPMPADLVPKTASPPAITPAPATPAPAMPAPMPAPATPAPAAPTPTPMPMTPPAAAPMPMTLVPASPPPLTPVTPMPKFNPLTPMDVPNVTPLPAPKPLSAPHAAPLSAPQISIPIPAAPPTTGMPSLPAVSSWRPWPTPPAVRMATPEILPVGGIVATAPEAPRSTP